MECPTDKPGRTMVTLPAVTNTRGCHQCDALIGTWVVGRCGIRGSNFGHRGLLGCLTFFQRSRVPAALMLQAVDRQSLNFGPARFVRGRFR